MRHFFFFLIVASLLAAPAGAQDRGQLLATAGILSPTGAAGGGITTWAILAGYGSADSWGGGAQVSAVALDDYDLTSAAIAVTIRDRFELFANHTRIDLPARLGLPVSDLSATTVGGKVKLAGDLIYGPIPQLSLSAYSTRNHDADVLNALGGLRQRDTGYHLALTRLWLDGPGHRYWLTNLGLRYDRATYLGLLGHGAPDADRKISAELAVAVFLRRNLALGVEYRQMPDIVPGVAEDDWKDLFLAWFPNKSLSIALAYVDAGEIAGLPGQRGVYAAVEGSW